MPDDWETANGLNPKSATDGNQLNDEGYTNVEIYLNSLVADITARQYEGGEEQGRKLQIDESQYSEYDISGQTSNGDWTFSGGFKMNQTGSPSTGSDATIKYSRDKQYTLTLPTGLRIEAVTVYGYCNQDGATAYLGELGGKTFVSTDYVFPARNASPSRATHKVTFDTPVSGTLTFTPKGDAQVCFKLTLHVAAPTAIDAVNADRRQDAIYRLDGQKANHTSQKGIYIINGRKTITR